MDNKIRELLEEAIAELNETLDDDDKVAFNDETRFVGANACIDSMSFINLISIVEELIEDKFDKSVKLVNEKAFSSKNSPFQSIDTFANYIKELLEDS